MQLILAGSINHGRVLYWPDKQNQYSRAVGRGWLAGSQGTFLKYRKVPYGHHWVGGSPQVRLARNKKRKSSSFIHSLDFSWISWTGPPEAASRPQGQGPQGRGLGQSAKHLHFVRLLGDFTCETPAFRKVFWRFSVC